MLFMKFCMTLFFISSWLGGGVIYAKKDADSDYKRIKKDGIKNHTPDVVERVCVFAVPLFGVIWLMGPWFGVAWFLLTYGTYLLMFEATVNQHMKKNLLYTGRTAKWDKFFHNMGDWGPMVKLGVKILILAAGMVYTVILFNAYGLV